ncbi:longitudinals lacking protein, isoforms H/M/V-like isoform X2 [Macrobrachium rosenbergii]|uniref:longitudinals lacking protein, isoforms H/M/V-like isoform X2 n=1 Tax=Macrobrachium rosenbergii TaxID=79674 RepID=UPI0034D68EEA
MDLSALIHLAGRMNQDQFLLKWNNHQTNFVEVFSYLRTQDAFVDVTLACDGKSFSAHKVVLSACSPYFQTLFQTNPCKHPIVFLKDVKGQELEALIEFIYKGEVSVSQSELGSLISTAENLKIKGLAEPDRPTEKAVKRIASPPRSQPPTLVSQATAVTPITVTQHLQVKYPQSSPVAKRKKTEQFNVQSSYVGIRENQEEVVTVEAENGENLSLRGENLSLRGENLTIRDHPPQVVLVPSHEVSSHQQEVTTHTPQPYASHHAPIPASESVLYSVSGTAIYAGTAQVTSSSRGGEQASRDVYPDQYHSSDESSVPGPSGIQTQAVPEASMGEEGIPFREATALGAETATCPPSTKAAVARAVLVATSPHLEPGPSSLKSQLVKDRLTPDEQTIKLEPTNANVPTESWEGSNQSYEDGGGGIAGSGSGAGVVPSTSDTLTMQLPLHTEMTEPSPLHDSSRGVAALRRLGRPHLCPFCSKVFPFKSILRNHMRIHTGEKPYACRVCGRTFNHCSNYYKHERVCALKLSETTDQNSGGASALTGGVHGNGEDLRGEGFLRGSSLPQQCNSLIAKSLHQSSNFQFQLAPQNQLESQLHNQQSLNLMDASPPNS